MDDRQIIGLLFARAESAVAELAARFGAGLRQLAMNILGSAQDAEECVNDTYLALWNAIPPARPEPLPPYVYRVGRNTALKRLRTNTAAARDSRYDISLDELAGCIPGQSMDALLDVKALGQAIDAFLRTQSATGRIIFLRRYWFGDSVRDIAQLLGMKEGAVSTRLSRTREALRLYLIKEGYQL